MRLLEKDPGADQPVWYGGPASNFVVARRFLETRAKDEGVWEFWTGEEDTNFFLNPPEIDYKYDAQFEDSLVQDNTQAAAQLRATAARRAPDPTTGDLGKEEDPVYSWEGSITLIDPYYYPAMSGEREPITGIRYAALCVKTSDVAMFKKHLRQQRDSALKWDEASRRFRQRVNKAEALGPAPTAAVRPLLNDHKVSEAWEALQNKYATKGDTDVIRVLEAHLKDVRLKHPSRLDEYVNTIDTLRMALSDCGVQKQDSEMIAILKDGILGTVEGKKAFEAIFTNVRMFHWDSSDTLEALATEAHALNQEQGIKSLHKMEIAREIERRRPPADVKAIRAAEAEVAATTTQKQSGGGPKGSSVGASAEAVKGSDGRLNPGVNCFRCHLDGHIAKFCPNRQPSSNTAAQPAEIGGGGVKGGTSDEAGPSCSHTSTSFDIEIDDNFAETDGEVFASDAEMIQIFLPKGEEAEGL
ncbi:hypothetical protein B484DRAFT_396272 [Ochromonadaceae sp. CCMP2298]|nr:hypothetical protein B484DRAFT_396272 [Ochromonadaceae sp. CCMP2298]